ncbi:putative C-mannosyltransferase DPY19L3 [Acipenser ruthenus]|uniref:Putative C-mannosyltransferase DPY19L3 n=1 Tax=Acipenser ruthenus TaxID=7906 RepID=A0A662YVK3_ACIRT|nr:putative C-mannosyltransferase DPY19L3 [Acipenser ruthenus]
MTALRQRKGSKGKEGSQELQKPETTLETKPRIPAGSVLWSVLWSVVGGLVAVSLGLLTCIYVATLHENDLWFSNIKEVEQEISFRTECGLYYSYYKQMLQASSVQEGLFELINDNTTESKRTINLLQRMNIYQEVFLGVLYRILPIQTSLEPVYFYIYTVFGLQTVYVIALYVTSWLLSGTWLSGALTAVWFILNRIDTTRVEFTIPLRENWSIPFLALQVAAITYYLRPQLKPLQQKLALSLIFLSTLTFSLTWQFNQFILLMQALALFALDCLDLVSTGKVTCLYLVQVSSLLLVWLLQFFNPMILGSLALSFIVAALTVNFFQKALQLRSDEHIYKFIKAKFGLGSTRDFDANLYLCEEAFGLLPFDTFERLSDSLVLYPYIWAVSIMTIVATVAAVRNLSDSTNTPFPNGKEEETFLRPAVAYNLSHTVVFGLLAYSTMRMKYLWAGHMCAFAAYGICSDEVWRPFLKVIRLHTTARERLIRYTVPVLLLGFLYYKFSPKLLEEMSELREFYDPDTVDLMNWISTKTSKKAVFAGSMQLLAGVKLCTGRVLTNHPHYEDKSLRERTRQVYQIYARQSPEDVHKILRSFGTDYVILEDSICYERRHNRGCRLRDLLDVSNGHIMDGPGENEVDLTPSPHPRFCDEIRTDQPPYTTYFTRVFTNKTFHVYKLKKGKKKTKSN